MLLYILPEEIPCLWVESEAVSSGVEVLYCDSWGEQEIEDIASEVSVLHAAHGGEANFLAVRRSAGEIFILDSFIGGGASFRDGDAENRTSQGGVYGGFVLSGGVEVKAAERFFNNSGL